LGNELAEQQSTTTCQQFNALFLTTFDITSCCIGE